MKKLIVFFLLLTLFVSGCSSTTTNEETNAPTTVEVDGHNGTITMEVYFEDNVLTDIVVVDHQETEGVADDALTTFPQSIIDAQSTGVDMISGATVTSAAIASGVEQAIEEAGVELTSLLEEEDDELFWSVQPTLGIIKGSYYKVEELFRQGHLGTLEVVVYEDLMVKVEFNEISRANYKNRFYQNTSKRLSEYNFDMAAVNGACWGQSIPWVEEQMVEEQRLTGDFDTVTGASGSVEQSMLPLAEQMEVLLEEESTQLFYSIAEDFGDGITGELKVIIEDGKIISCMYDEIFADTPEEIAEASLQKYYRMSKYHSVMYDDASRIGFNVQMDALNERVVETQYFFDIEDLPATGSEGDYETTGYTIRSTAWDNYLSLAEQLNNVIVEDGALY